MSPSYTLFSPPGKFSPTGRQWQDLYGSPSMVSEHPQVPSIPFCHSYPPLPRRATLSDRNRSFFARLPTGWSIRGSHKIWLQQTDCTGRSASDCMRVRGIALIELDNENKRFQKKRNSAHMNSGMGPKGAHLAIYPMCIFKPSPLQY